MKQLIKRHLRLFFRDKATVFFSMLAVLIAIMLYILFLADILVGAIEDTVVGATANQVRTVMSGIILGGTVAVGTVTSSLSGIGRLIIDKEDLAKDFYSSPMKHSRIIISYVIASCIIAITMSGFSLLLTVGYLILRGAALPTAIQMIQLLLTLLLGVISANSLMVLLVSRIKSRNALGSIGSIIGTLIGFLAGVYIPLGQLPNTVNRLVHYFPTAHTASLFRQILTDNLLSGFSNYVGADAITEIQTFFGITLQLGTFETNFIISTFYLVGTSVVFYWIGIRGLKKSAH